jgi:glutamyl-tRNA reductase
VDLGEVFERRLDVLRLDVALLGRPRDVAGSDEVAHEIRILALDCDRVLEVVAALGQHLLDRTHDLRQCLVGSALRQFLELGPARLPLVEVESWLAHLFRFDRGYVDRNLPGRIDRGSAVSRTSQQETERLLAVGVSHRHAPLEVRERLFLADGHALELAAALAGDGVEAVVLSTCNRTEIYLAGGSEERAREELERRSGLELGDVLASWEEETAVEHLFRVAAGLDSLVPGEAQILGQVRQAYDAALTAGTTGPLLNRLLEDALRAGKRVRTEASLAELPESVAASAVELAAKTLGGIENRRALLFGAGKMSELAARDLRARGAEVVVSSRTLESAEELAGRVGGRAAAFDAVAVELTDADLVISATRCPYPILHAEAVQPRAKPLVLVDVAVPRDLDAAIGELEGCTLFDIDDLGEGLVGREEDVREAEEIVAQEAVRFAQWRRSRSAAGAIRALRDRAETIRSEELARAEPRLAELSPRERKTVETLTSQIVNKLLHAPTVRAKESGSEPLRDLFALREDGE